MPMTKKVTTLHSLDKENGFTLIELLIVIVILGMLMSLVAPAMFSKVGSTKSKTALIQMEMLTTSIDAYMLDVGYYPKDLDELRSSSLPGWDGPYLPKSVPLDPWGRDYIFKPEPSEELPYTLMSYGRDGEEGGEGEDEDVILK